MKYLMNIAKYIKVFLVLSFIIFEEIVWNKIGKPAYESVKSLKIMYRFKEWVSQVENRYTILIIFLTPFVLMEVFSIMAIKAFATGAIITGIGLYVFKIVLTAPVVIIFNSAKPELVSFPPIRFGYDSILKLKRSVTFRSVKKYIKSLKVEVRKFKKEYLDGDVSFLDELKKMYQDIKKL